MTFNGAGTAGLLERNTISANEEDGVRIIGAAPRIAYNDIHSGKKAGILIQGGTARIEHNVIHSHAYNGVLIWDGDPLIRSNRISGSTYANVAFSGAATKGHLESNAIYGSYVSGVAVMKGASPIVEGNIINGNNTLGCSTNVRAGGL